MKSDTFSYSGMSIARIGLLDVTLLLTMWLLVFVSSINNYGNAPAIIFILLNVLLVKRRTTNGILVLLVIFYSPAVSLGITMGPFVLSASILYIKYIVKDVFLDSKWSPVVDPITTFVALFVAYALLAILIAPDTTMAFKYYIKYIEGLILLIIVTFTIKSREDLGRIFKWWAIVSGLSLFIKLAHIFIGDDTVLYHILENVNVGSDFSLDHRLRINIGGDVTNRLMWPGEEPNYSSAALIFPFAVALAFFSGARSWSRVHWLIIACMIGVSVIGTFSRSGLISVLVVTLMFVAHGRKITTIIPAVFVGGIILYLMSAVPLLGERFSSIGSEIQGGGSERYGLWSSGIDMWSNSPLIGNGLSSFYYEHHVAAHNTYIQLLSETGLIGFGLFLTVIFVSLKTGFKLKTLYALPSHPDVAFSQVVLFGLVGMSLMIGTIAYQDIKLFWTCCAVCAAMYLVAKREIKRISK